MNKKATIAFNFMTSLFMPVYLLVNYRNNHGKPVYKNVFMAQTGHIHCMRACTHREGQTT